MLFTVPSRYSFAIARCAYLALERGRPSFTPGCSCPALLRQALRAAAPARLRGCHALWRRFPVGFVARVRRARGPAVPPQRSLQPHDRNGCRLATAVVWAYPVSLATTPGMLSVPRGTKMFQFPRCPPHRAVSVSRTGCPIRTSWDHSLRAAPPRFSQRCRVLHRRAAARHPPCAPAVFPAGTPGARGSRRRAAPDVPERFACQSALGKVPHPGVRRGSGPSPLNRDVAQRRTGLRRTPPFP